ncbi:TonB family protein [Salipiger sp. P9]|uniref:energy transducer TonB family protein n=1 Tax=Salipiger pentaromativorans TaxID=2943193 RepID=UPI0021584A10|nr:energy transducer TonB [Salipiger pentaromativorans]MCR8546511.1 TonB family protein [Salipiger pentaromativorans]
MRLAEALIFIPLAGAVHLAALTAGLDGGGGAPQGDGGADSVTLLPVSGNLAALAERWDSPPEIVAADAPVLPPSPPPVPTAALAASPAPSAALPPAALTVPALPTPPALDTASAPPRHAPAQSPRPEARPVPAAQPKAPARTDTATAPKPASAPPRAGQTAKGSRSSTAPAKPAGPSKAQIASAKADWGAQIRSAVARAQSRIAPPKATGQVRLRIALTPQGRIAALSLLRSSGNAEIDRAALAVAKRARYPRAPRALTAGSYSFDLPLAFARR